MEPARVSPYLWFFTLLLSLRLCGLPFLPVLLLPLAQSPAQEPCGGTDLGWGNSEEGMLPPGLTRALPLLCPVLPAPLSHPPSPSLLPCDQCCVHGDSDVTISKAKLEGPGRRQTAGPPFPGDCSRLEVARVMAKVWLVDQAPGVGGTLCPRSLSRSSS